MGWLGVLWCIVAQWKFRLLQFWFIRGCIAAFGKGSYVCQVWFRFGSILVALCGQACIGSVLEQSIVA